MRGGTFVLVLLLTACGHVASDVSALQPGVDVARAALRGGSPQTALEIAGKILVENPGNEAALVLQGDALTELGRLDEAERSYEAALKTNPQSVDAEIGIGRIELASNPAAAEATFLKALRYDPRNLKALNDLGVARDLEGHHTDAQVAYRKALGIDPEDNAAEVNLALSIAMSGNAQDAVRMLQPLASGPGATLKMKHDLAAALAMSGNRQAAADILSQDLPPQQVQQALDAYTSARTGGPVAIAPSPPRADEPVMLAPPSGPASGWSVQFAALPTEQSALRTWQHLQTRMPALLGSRQPDFIKIERSGETFWRVRTGGFTGAAEADAFCAKVKAAGNACLVTEE